MAGNYTHPVHTTSQEVSQKLCIIPSSSPSTECILQRGKEVIFRRCQNLPMQGRKVHPVLQLSHSCTLCTDWRGMVLRRASFIILSGQTLLLFFSLYIFKVFTHRQELIKVPLSKKSTSKINSIKCSVSTT